MFETLYKTDTPQTFWKAASITGPAMTSSFATESSAFFVREKHGYWDESLKKHANETVTLSPEEGFSTFAEAQARYDQQLRYRASQGFVHSFSLDFLSSSPVKYRRLSY